MIKLASISNNYGESYDGVGDFARAQNVNFPDDIKVINYTAKCTYEVPKIKRLFSLGMIKATCKLIRDLKNNKIDAVIIEYPFVEWNPLILLPVLKLSYMLKKQGILILSLHEYDRVNILRKKIIQIFCMISDLVFVSNDKIKEAVRPFCKKICIRPIPTNLYNEDAINCNNISKNNNRYVYFGLVNKAKAFNEMLCAWDKFNENCEYELYILSGTPLYNLENKHKGVKYIYNGTDYEIISLMRSAKACFLPVKPFVDNKNTTFKTACLAGCICIGLFSDEYKNFDFVLNMRDYSCSSFVNAMNKVSTLENDKTRLMQHKAIEFGLMFSPKVTSSIVAQEIKKMIGEKYDNMR